MATRNVKARVEIDGEREYKAALAELNNGNRVLASEMRKLQAEYKGNAESTEYLTKRGEVLERQLLQQKDKVEALRQALNNAAQQYGEADSRTQAWAVKLNDAEAAQYKLEHAIEENNEALKANEGQLKTENASLVSVGDTVDDLAGKFGVRLPDGLKKSLDNLQGFSSGTVLAMSATAAGVAALTKVVEELHDITKKAAADVDEILTESMTTGLSTRTIQQLKYAENLIDVSYSTITGTLTKLTQNMDKARDGNEAMAASFASLGVAIQDGTTGQLRDVESVFYEVIDALGQIENPTERDAAAMELLGKSAQELNPLILQGSGVLKDLAEQAEATGYVLDESMLQKLGEVDDAAQKLDLTFDGVKKELAVEFAPASKEAMEIFARAVKSGGDTLARSGIISGLGETLTTLLELGKSVLDLIDVFVPFEGALSVLKDALYGVAYILATMSDGINAVKSLMTLDFQGFGNALGFGYASGNANNAQRVRMSYEGRLSGYDSFYADPQGASWSIGSEAYAPSLDDYNQTWVENERRLAGFGGHHGSFNASGNQNWRGGLTYLGENGPEMAILPRGTRILSAQEARMSGDSFGDIYISIDPKNVREFNDIIEIAKSARVRQRMK